MTGPCIALSLCIIDGLHLACCVSLCCNERWLGQIVSKKFKIKSYKQKLLNFYLSSLTTTTSMLQTHPWPEFASEGGNGVQRLLRKELKGELQMEKKKHADTFSSSSFATTTTPPVCNCERFGNGQQQLYVGDIASGLGPCAWAVLEVVVVLATNPLH